MVDTLRAIAHLLLLIAHQAMSWAGIITHTALITLLIADLLTITVIMVMGTIIITTTRIAPLMETAPITDHGQDLQDTGRRAGRIGHRVSNTSLIGQAKKSRPITKKNQSRPIEEAHPVHLDLPGRVGVV